MQRAQGFAEQGDQRVFTGGQTSTNVVQGSFPRATVTVFFTGTSILATLYANNGTPPTPLANPFTADSNGHWFFYAPDGRYDVRLSGAGLCPWTMSDLLLNESPGGGVNLKGSVATAGALPSTGNKIGDAYIARDTGHLWVWDGTQWVDVGQAGGGVHVKGSVPTESDLPTTGNKPGDAYIVLDTGEMWVWDGTAWRKVSLSGGGSGEIEVRIYSNTIGKRPAINFGTYNLILTGSDNPAMNQVDIFYEADPFARMQEIEQRIKSEFEARLAALEARIG